MSTAEQPHLAALAETLRASGVVCEVESSGWTAWLQAGSLPVFCHSMDELGGLGFCTVGCRRLGAAHDLIGSTAKLRELLRRGWPSSEAYGGGR